MAFSTPVGQSTASPNLTNCLDFLSPAQFGGTSLCRTEPVFQRAGKLTIKFHLTFCDAHATDAIWVLVGPHRPFPHRLSPLLLSGRTGKSKFLIKTTSYHKRLSFPPAITCCHQVTFPQDLTVSLFANAPDRRIPSEPAKSGRTSLRRTQPIFYVLLKAPMTRRRQ